jgi:integrase/recombinase XerD
MTTSNAIREFLLHCKLEKNLSEKTLKAYGIDLRQFKTFLATKEMIADVTRQDIRDYIASLSALKPKSVKRKLASTKALFNFLEFEDSILVNPFRKMRMNIKEPQTLPSVLDMPEMIKIFKAGYQHKNELKNKNGYAYRESVRNIVVLELLFTTGARVSEIAGLKQDSISVQSGNITIRGKGNKERIIQVCNKETITMLRHYLALFQDNIMASGGWFLVNRFNKKLSDQSIRNMVKTIAGKAGLTRRVTPHIFRHSFATLLLEKDVDIKYIQSLLGHSSIMTTQIYTHVNRAKQKQILRSKHPRKDFLCGQDSLVMQDN